MTLTKRILSLASMALMTLAILVAIGPGSQAAAADCFNPYAVGPTESWHSIANVCKLDYDKLRELNHRYDRPRDILYVGDLLTLPDRDQKPQAGLFTYTVQPGDSWYRIAQDHNLTFRDVRAFNPKLWLKRCIFIRPGDVMMLPWTEPMAVETPVVETPAVETPAAETPVVETPVVETSPLLMDASGCPTMLDFGDAYSIGHMLKVVSPTPLDLYANEGDRSQVVGTVAPETILKLMTNTACADGWLWWQVTDEAQGLTGWVSVEFTAVPVLDPAE